MAPNWQLFKQEILFTRKKKNFSDSGYCKVKSVHKLSGSSGWSESLFPAWMGHLLVHCMATSRFKFVVVHL